MIEQRYKEYDVALERIFKNARAEGHTIPCQRGCDACCYEAVILFDVEMPPIVKHLRSMSKPMLAEIRERVLEWVRGMKRADLDLTNDEPDPHAYYRAHLPCPLLDLTTHECRVYPARPLACRGHHIVDATPEVCARRGEEGSVIPWLEIRPGVVQPMMNRLIEDARREASAGGEVTLTVGLLPTFLAKLWPAIDRSTSLEEWIHLVSQITAEQPAAAKDV